MLLGITIVCLVLYAIQSFFSGDRFQFTVFWILPLGVLLGVAGIGLIILLIVLLGAGYKMMTDKDPRDYLLGLLIFIAVIIVVLVGYNLISKNNIPRYESEYEGCGNYYWWC